MYTACFIFFILYGSFGPIIVIFSGFYKINKRKKNGSILLGVYIFFVNKGLSIIQPYLPNK